MNLHNVLNNLGQYGATMSALYICVLMLKDEKDDQIERESKHINRMLLLMIVVAIPIFIVMASI